MRHHPSQGPRFNSHGDSSDRLLSRELQWARREGHPFQACLPTRRPRRLCAGEARSERTRETIEIGPDQHVHDAYAEFINHSFTPNLEVRGREVIAITAIAVGDELSFGYLENESSIVVPFICHETGRRVGASRCEDAPVEG